MEKEIDPIENEEYIDVEVNEVNCTEEGVKKYDFVSDFQWTKEMEENAKKIVDENTNIIQDKFLMLQERNWNKFYKHNTTNFFKDRHYILAEFPELSKDDRDLIKFLDVGCGVGNSFYPLLEKKNNMIVKGFDISSKAIEMAKTHKLYNDKQIEIIPLDVVKDEIPESFKEADYSILMFVLSAIMPEEYKQVLTKIYDSLKNNGILYFRDYCRYDMAQLRFSLKGKNKIQDNLYIRHDKTLAYYFDQKEIEDLCKSIGFEVVESKVICRMIKNRKLNKEMHRLWLQIKFIKKIN